MNLPVIIILFAGLIISAVACAILRDLLKAAIALAVTSAILSIAMFVLGATLAAVFELSVCAGLITVIFISAISMTKVRSKEELEQKQRKRAKRFILLPVLLIVAGAAILFFLWPRVDSLIPAAAASASNATVQDVLWNKRQVDLLGQIVIILVGVLGVTIYFKEDDAE